MSNGADARASRADYWHGSMDFDWLIVGGGIHGTHLALVLRERGGVPAHRLRILDPRERLLARWETCTTACGMRYLRSTAVHHLALDPHDLLRFAQSIGAEAHHFHGRYQRPSLDIFRAHCQAIIEQHRLNELHLRGRVIGLRRFGAGWQAETEQGSVTARNVLLALSIGEQLRWPDWASAARQAGARVVHLYEADFDRERVTTGQTIAIIGGGISAGHLALTLSANANVTLVMRHPIRIAPFDSPPGWMGPKELRCFHAEPDMRKRRAMITSARQPGTMPVELAQALTNAIQRQQLRLLIDEVQEASNATDGKIMLRLREQQLAVDRVILATGFTAERPGHPWLTATIAEAELPVADCGYPIIRPDLQWAPGLYVTGPLAELELGPVARNIIGARHAGERLGS